MSLDGFVLQKRNSELRVLVVKEGCHLRSKLRDKERAEKNL
jgi:hypothetical protein